MVFGTLRMKRVRVSLKKISRGTQQGKERKGRESEIVNGSSIYHYAQSFYGFLSSILFS